MHDPDAADCAICILIYRCSTPTQRRERRDYYRTYMGELMHTW